MGSIVHGEGSDQGPPRHVTNAHRADEIADHYRARGCRVVRGDLHVTSLPRAVLHADAVCLVPGEGISPRVRADARTPRGAPPVRRDLVRIGKTRRTAFC